MRRLFLSNKRGITPVIAIILLLILTVSSAGTAFYWLYSIEGQISAEDQLNIKRYGDLEGQLKIVAARYDASVGDLVIFLENIGGTTIPVETASKTPTTLWLLENEQQEVICSTDWSGVDNSPVCKEGCMGAISSGELRQIVLGNLGANTLCNVENQPSESLLHYTVDFSGKAAVDGGFVR